MTSIQVQYWELQERKRNNAATLEEQKRHNAKTEALTQERNANDYELGNRNLDLGYLNSERNYEIGRESNAIGWQNSQYNYILGVERNQEQQLHNAITEGMQARTGIDYAIWGANRVGDVTSNVVGQGRKTLNTVLPGVSSAVSAGSTVVQKIGDWFRDRISESRHTHGRSGKF